MRDYPVSTVLCLLVALFVSSCGPGPGPQPAPPGDPASRVEQGLIPLDDDWQPRWDERAALAERMEHRKVPGVSIAVIEGFEPDWARGAALPRRLLPSIRDPRPAFVERDRLA